MPNVILSSGGFYTHMLLSVFPGFCMYPHSHAHWPNLACHVPVPPGPLPPSVFCRHLHQCSVLSSVFCWQLYSQTKGSTLASAGPFIPRPTPFPAWPQPHTWQEHASTGLLPLSLLCTHMHYMLRISLFCSNLQSHAHCCQLTVLTCTGPLLCL